MTTLEKIRKYENHLRLHKHARWKNDPLSGHWNQLSPDFFELTAPYERQVATQIKEKVMGR
jgi:hypothetical protein